MTLTAEEAPARVIHHMFWRYILEYRIRGRKVCEWWCTQVIIWLGMVKEEVSDIECSGDDGERDSPRPGQGRGEERGRSTSH